MKDYGGAYDIDPEQYFTRDDIVEFSENVCDRLGEKYDASFEIVDVYMDTPTRIYLSVSDDEGNEVDTFVDIDMHKIRRPADLIRKYSEIASGELQATYDKLISEYIGSAESFDSTATYVFPKFTPDDRSVARREYNLSIIRESAQGTVVSGSLEDIQNFADEYLGYELNEEYLSIESASVSGAEGDRPSWWYEPDDYDTENEFEETAEIPLDQVIVTVDYDNGGSWDIDKNSIESAIPEEVSSDIYPIRLLDKNTIYDEFEECVYDVLPDDSGKYLLSCTLVVECYITGLYTEQYEDEEVGWNTENANVEVTGSTLKNIKWKKLD